MGDRSRLVQGPGADYEEKHELASDIDTVVVDSLKALDPEWPIREAEMLTAWLTMQSTGSKQVSASNSLITAINREINREFRRIQASKRDLRV